MINFVYHEDCENLLSNKKHLPRGIFADRQYSQDTETKEGYCDLSTKQPSITTHTRAGARWKENSLKYMEEGME